MPGASANREVALQRWSPFVRAVARVDANSNFRLLETA
jgi:hypothetical protein